MYYSVISNTHNHPLRNITHSSSDPNPHPASG